MVKALKEHCCLELPALGRIRSIIRCGKNKSPHLTLHGIHHSTSPRTSSIGSWAYGVRLSLGRLGMTTDMAQLRMLRKVGHQVLALAWPVYSCHHGDTGSNMLDSTVYN